CLPRRMCRHSWLVTRCWQILIPINLRNFSTTIRSIRNAFRPFPHARRGCPKHRVAEFSKLVFPKGRSAWHSHLLVSGRLLHNRQLGARHNRGAQLALSALVGNSHSHPCPSLAERKAPPAEEPALFGRF